METYKLSIEITTTEEDDVYIIHSKEMQCEYPIKKDLKTLKSEISDLIQEWVEFNQYE